MGKINDNRAALKSCVRFNSSYQEKYLNFRKFKNVALSSLKCKFDCIQVYKVIYI